MACAMRTSIFCALIWSGLLLIRHHVSVGVFVCGEFVFSLGFLDVLDPRSVWFPSARSNPAGGGGILLLGSVVCPRDLCDTVGNLYSGVTNGAFARLLERSHHRCRDPCTVDHFLGLYLKEHSVGVGMFRNVAAVVCWPECEGGQKYRHNDESHDFEATKAMMWALTVKVKGWLPSLLWKVEL